MRNEEKEVELRWPKPEVGRIALNVDASVHRGRGISSCGGVLFDCNGKWVRGFLGKKNYGNIESAESWAILEGLEFAWGKGIICVEV